MPGPDVGARDRALPAPIPIAPESFKSGFIGIVGRPNVGKSTLMNQLVGQKIAIATPVAQTTRNRLRGILTTETAQFIFVDTPGIHKPHHELGRVIVKNALATVEAVDVLLFVVDGSVPAGGGDRFIAQILQRADVPVVLGANKIDRRAEVDAEAIAASYTELRSDRDWPLVDFSALTGSGLDALLAQLDERLTPGPYYYPPDLVTDRPERFIIGELIREQILLHARQEIPHSVAIVVEAVETTPTIANILATIHVERQSQKGILIGKGGSMLKSIGSAAREQIQKLIVGKVYLELYVRVQPKWRQSRSQLADFGYAIEDA
uniref:GTPase Era n=1 Tax=Rubidibacter lacunae TaxID=582514 RepID=UPI002FBEA19C